MRFVRNIILFLLLPIISVGQENLIRNWSFEDLRWPNSEFPCPTSLGGISSTAHWKTADGSVDYFNACSNED